jgi:type II secretory ATPase GspE/PulE/Tfp pilus assembly ATPase PilB-like protein
MPNGRTHQRLGDILTEEGLISVLQLRSLLREQAEAATSRVERPRLGQLLLRYQLLDEPELARALALQHECPYLEPDPANVKPQLFPDVPARLVRTYDFVPLGRDPETLTVAVSSFDEPDLPELLRSVTGLDVSFGLTTDTVLGQLREAYLASLDGARNVLEVVEDDAVPAASETAASAGRVSSRVQTHASSEQIPAATASRVEPPPAEPAPVRVQREPAWVRANEAEPVEIPFPRGMDNLMCRLLQTSLRERYSNVAFAPNEGPVSVVARRPGGRTDRTTIGAEARQRVRRALATTLGLDEAALQSPACRKFRWPHEEGTALFEAVLFPPSGPQLELNLLSQTESSWEPAEAGFPVAAEQLLATSLQEPNGLMVLSGHALRDTWRLWVALLGTLSRKDRKVMAFEASVSHEVPGVFHHALSERPGDQGELFSEIGRMAFSAGQSDVLALHTERLPKDTPMLLEHARTEATVLLTLSASTPLGALRKLEQAAQTTLHSGLFVTAYRLSRLCPFCREAFPIPASGLPRGAQGLADKVAHRAPGCDACQFSGQFGAVHFYEVLRLDGEQLDRDGIDFYSRPLKEYLLEEGLLVPALPAARRALLAGVIGLDQYLALANRE